MELLNMTLRLSVLLIATAVLLVGCGSNGSDTAAAKTTPAAGGKPAVAGDPTQVKPGDSVVITPPPNDPRFQQDPKLGGGK